MKSKNTILYIALGIVLIYTVGYFVVVNKISYAFSYDEAQTLYDNKINLILASAKLYGENNLDLFEENDTIYVSVNDLVEKNFLLADEDGKVLDPTSDVKTLNDLKVRITYKNQKIETKILK